MMSISQIISNLAHVEVGVKCRKCGAILQLVGKQYTVRCPRCGNIITVTPTRLAELKVAEHRNRMGVDLRQAYRCEICKDQGFVILEQQVDDAICEFGYRCLCQAGAARDDLVGWPLLPEELAKSYQTALTG